MDAKALIGLWEFTGFWVEALGRPVMPPSGTRSSTLREFLFFDSDDTFFFTKFPRDETIYFDPETRRFVCAEFRSELLKGNWQLKGNQLLESVSQRDDSPPVEQSFELAELSANRLIVKEPAGGDTKFLKVVYARGDVEGFPAPPLADNIAEDVADDISESSPARLEEEAGRIQAEQNLVEALLASGKRNSAHRLAQYSVRHSERVFGRDHPNTAACLCTLGACLVKLGESKAAIPEMERAKLIYETHFGPNDLMTASALNNLAPAYRDQNDFRAAIAAARDAVRIRWAALGAHGATATSVQNLGLALSGLGLLNEALRCYYTAETMFRDALGPAHPRTQGILQNIERLSEAVKGDPRFGCDSLPEVGASDIGMAAVQKTLDICEGMLQAEPASDLFTLACGRAAHKESYDHLILAIRTQERLIAAHPGDEVTRLEHLRRAQSHIRESVRAPVGKFSGFLKRVDRSKLGPKSQATLEHVFPNFGGDAIERAQRRNEALKEFGIDPHATPTFTDQKRERAESLGYDVKMVGRQFRRYAGENNLPSRRYFSVCVDASGDDQQTLCRELFEYTDPRIPGFVFVSDTADPELMGALSSMGMPRPRVAGIFVFLLPPIEKDEQLIFRHFIGPVLTLLHGPYESAPDKWDGLSVVFIPTELLPVEIDEVIDLRQPATQDWLFHFFKNGDGAVWFKTAETEITGFAEMLPSLVYPEYGGSGVTKSIGSWMRSAGIQGLVFPSARSNAAIEVDQHAALRSFHGWNFVDYRGVELVPDMLLHVDNNDWYGFVAGRQSAPVLRQDGKSWAVEGAEQRYEQTRQFMLELLTVAHL
jgi:tetratricopeptide (TPR) repeat protein